jgi:hypothetical protein
VSESIQHRRNGIGDSLKRLLAKPITIGQALILLVLIFGLLVLGKVVRTRASVKQAKGADLTAFVESVKRQLERVESDRVKAGDPALFGVKDFDLELTVVAKEDTKGTSGVKAEVVTADMEEQLSHEVSQKIVLHMTLAPPQTITIQESKEPISVEGAERLPTVKLETHK